MEGINVNETNNDGETALSGAGSDANYTYGAYTDNTEPIRALLREHGALELHEIENDNESENAYASA